MNINNSGPNEWKKGYGIHEYPVVRGIRTLRAGVPATAKTWTLRRNTGGTESKGFSVQTAAFFMNHPTIAIVTLWLIAVIGFVCILELPIRWALF
jgi:hypothetical protein